MKDGPQFREADVSRSGDASIRLADLLSVATNFACGGDSPTAVQKGAEEPFARGRYRARTLRSSMQCVDCDLEFISQATVKAEYAPSLCIGLLLKGAWSSCIDGKLFQLTNVGVPSIIAAGETFEAVASPTLGDHCRMAALHIRSDFFATIGADPECSFERLSELLKPGISFQEFPSCEVLRALLQKLYDNPYHGAMARIYAESLALSIVVELGIHLQGGCGHGPAPRWYDTLAYEARAILDRELAAPLSVRDLAQKVGLSETVLRRVFKATFGTTILDYLRDRRLEAARVMLREQRFQIAEIAYRVGYSDPANFTNAYKRRYGHPPTVEVERFKQ